MVSNSLPDVVGDGISIPHLKDRSGGFMKMLLYKVTKCLKNNKGEGYIDLIFKMSFIMALIFCFIALPPLYIKKQNVDYMANSIARAVETTGEINSDVNGLISQLKSDTGMNPLIRWEGNFFGSTNKIQIRESFFVTVSDTATIQLAKPSFSEPIVISIPISKRVRGVSEVYWKP